MQNFNLALLLAAGLAVSGCGTGVNDESNEATRGAPAGGSTKIAALPDLRPGLWRTTMIEGDAPGGDEPEDNCVGPGENLVGSLGVDKNNRCSKREIRLEGGRYVFDIACKNSNADIIVQGSLGGDFTTSVTGDLTLGLGVPGQKIETRSYKYSSRYVGSCTPEVEG